MYMGSLRTMILNCTSGITEDRENLSVYACMNHLKTSLELDDAKLTKQLPEMLKIAQQNIEMLKNRGFIENNDVDASTAIARIKEMRTITMRNKLQQL